MTYTAYGNVLVSNSTVSVTSSPYIYTSTGTNGTWSNPSTNTAATLEQNGTLELRGKNADLKVNGVSLTETLKTIQEMLGVMKMDSELEREFEELKQAGIRYRQLRDKFQEQKAVWDTLKNQDL